MFHWSQLLVRYLLILITFFAFQIVKMTENLWKKEINGENTLYVDLFKAIDPQNFTKLDDQLQTLKTEHSKNFAKNNETSSELLNEGSQYFQESNFYRAMDSYTKSLCFAEIGTANVALAFANRAKCFYQLELYDQALTDIELALAAGCTENLMPKLEKLRVDCHEMKRLNRISQSIAETIRNLDLEADEKFPCIANVLKITNNAQFGRHIIAKCDIDVGQNVLMEESFASVGHGTEQMCYTCNTEAKNFIPCPECSEVVFCNNECMKSNLVHKMDCKTPYHRMPKKVKFIIRTILMAVASSSDIDSLMTFVEGCVSNDSMPEAVKDLKSKYHLYLKLKKADFNENVLSEIHDLFKMIMIIPSVATLFDSERKQRFLMHLLLHYLAVNVNNGYENDATTSIGAVLCLFNHSCAPNLFNYAVDNQKFCVTIRPVKKGEQLFISYLGRCNKMQQDSCFKFISRNYKSDSSDYINVTQMKKKCIKFLQKYGHLPFSDELEFISDVFITLI